MINYGDILDIGKYRGKKVEEILRDDPSYFIKLSRTFMVHPDVIEHAKDLLNCIEYES